MSLSLRQRRIFVVDDEEIIAATIALILRKQGFNATAFTLPQEALEASRTDAPDLLISDVVMPMLNGIELAIRVQQVRPECKVLLFSGQAYTQNLLEAAQTKGNHFEVLSKPVHPTDLLKKIEEQFGFASA